MTPSAAGLRQMLPRQMNNRRFFVLLIRGLVLLIKGRWGRKPFLHMNDLIKTQRQDNPLFPKPASAVRKQQDGGKAVREGCVYVTDKEMSGCRALGKS